MQSYEQMSREELLQEKESLEKQYREICKLGLKLDMSRGKPSKAQLDLSMGMMDVLNGDSDLVCEEGVDCRNYGVIDGIKEAKQLFADMMEFFNKSQKEVFGWEGGPLHDPVTCAYLIDPTVLTVKEMYTEIDHGCYGPSYGRTNCDFFGMSDKEPKTKVAVDIDVEKFWDIIEEGIRNYG